MEKLEREKMIRSDEFNAISEFKPTGNRSRQKIFTGLDKREFNYLLS